MYGFKFNKKSVHILILRNCVYLHFMQQGRTPPPISKEVYASILMTRKLICKYIYIYKQNISSFYSKKDLNLIKKKDYF